MLSCEPCSIKMDSHNVEPQFSMMCLVSELIASYKSSTSAHSWRAYAAKFSPQKLLTPRTVCRVAAQKSLLLSFVTLSHIMFDMDTAVPAVRYGWYNTLGLSENRRNFPHRHFSGQVIRHSRGFGFALARAHISRYTHGCVHLYRVCAN